MSVTTPRETRALIVTASVLESTDITEAMHWLDSRQVMHVRKTEEVIPFLSDAGFRPEVAFISYSRGAMALNQINGVLAARATEIVLIDAPEDIVSSVGATALQRPFTLHDLAKLFDSLRGSGLGRRVESDTI